MVTFWQKRGSVWAYLAFCAILHSLKHTLKCWLPSSLSKSSYQVSPSRVKQGPKCRTKRNSCLLPPLQLHTRTRHGSTHIKKQHSKCYDLMPLCSFRTVTIAISKQEHITETAYNKHTGMCFPLVRLMTMLHAMKFRVSTSEKSSRPLISQCQSVPSRYQLIYRHFVEHTESGTYDWWLDNIRSLLGRKQRW